MKRTISTIATLAVLAAATAVAAKIEKDDIVQMKPPPDLRTDQTTPGLRDSLTTAPTVDTNIELAQSGALEGEKPPQGMWRPPPAERPDR